MKINVTTTAKHLILATGIVCAIIIVVGIFFADKAIPYILGVLLGYASCCVRIYLSDHSLAKTIDMPQKNAENYSRLQFLLRYFVAAIFLTTAALLPNMFSLLGAALGTIAMQFGAYVVRFIFKEGDFQK